MKVISVGEVIPNWGVIWKGVQRFELWRMAIVLICKDWKDLLQVREAIQCRRDTEVKATLHSVIFISGLSISAFPDYFNTPCRLSCHQASSWLEFFIPAHSPAFHTHHMEPYAALTLCHLSSAWETKTLAFQRLNKFPLLYSFGGFCGFSCSGIYIKIVPPSSLLPKHFACISFMSSVLRQDEAVKGRLFHSETFNDESCSLLSHDHTLWPQYRAPCCF